MVDCFEYIRHIRPGSIIYSYGLAVFSNIVNIGGGIYDYNTVIHQHNFVNPQRPHVHTQNAENMWKRTKSKLRRQQGTNKNLFSTYLTIPSTALEDNTIWRKLFVFSVSAFSL